MGENGTGKELIARSLHRQSTRKEQPFIHVDLGSIPETLFESELFGHVRGAFTDAKTDRTGRFESASGGTLFLDEIGNLNLHLQAKLLTCIQHKQIIRVGSNDQIPIDVRIVSATNMPLIEMAETFRFRQDLLYRLNTIELVVPPLRERKIDIKPIADYYIKLFSGQYNKKISISEEAYENMLSYHWPGNIRELAHVIERAVILDRNGLITPENLSLRKRSASSVERPVKEMSVEDFEKKAIIESLSRNKGNLSKSSEELGIARSTLYRKIAYFGLESYSGIPLD
jgi:transcriptional regulator with PAS, ATPase and Fis domain